jgi:hypothetical protein
MRRRIDLSCGRTRMGVAALCCLAIAPAFAQELPGQHTRFELTAYGAYRVGGVFEQEDGDGEFELDEGGAEGLVFNFPAANVDTQWQALYAHQQTELETQPGFDPQQRLGIDIDYFQFGGTYLFEGDETRPFIALTAGVAHFGPTITDIESETYLSGSLGGGVQLLRSKRVGVRLEARVFATLVDSDGALFCRSGPEGSACAITIAGTALFQWEASAGVVFRF